MPERCHAPSAASGGVRRGTARFGPPPDAPRLRGVRHSPSKMIQHWPGRQARPVPLAKHLQAEQPVGVRLREEVSFDAHRCCVAWARARRASGAPAADVDREVDARAEARGRLPRAARALPGAHRAGRPRGAARFRDASARRRTRRPHRWRTGRSRCDRDAGCRHMGSNDTTTCGRSCRMKAAPAAREWPRAGPGEVPCRGIRARGARRCPGWPGAPELLLANRSERREIAQRGVPAFPASPRVAVASTTRTPSSAYLATLPPVRNLSSSGCANIGDSTRTMGSLLNPASGLDP